MSGGRPTEAEVSPFDGVGRSWSEIVYALCREMILAALRSLLWVTVSERTILAALIYFGLLSLIVSWRKILAASLGFLCVVCSRT